jgi:hypothetical protein
LTSFAYTALLTREEALEIDCAGIDEEVVKRLLDAAREVAEAAGLSSAS